MLDARPESKGLDPLAKGTAYAVAVPSSAAVEVKPSGGARLPGCRTMKLYNNSTVVIYYGFTTAEAASGNGMPLAASGGQEVLDLAESGKVYVRGASGTSSDLRVVELARS